MKLMIPFCRTPREGQRVLELLASHGLTRGENGLDVYVMAEIPANAILADEFAALFDGFSGLADLLDEDEATSAVVVEPAGEAAGDSCLPRSRSSWAAVVDRT